MNGQGLEKTSSPKLTVPIVSEHESGAASSTRSRSSSGSCTEPPVDSCTTSVVSDRIAATVSRSRPRSSVGRCSPSRMWMWIMPAPDASHRRAVSTSSSSVVGSAGKSAFSVSAPVGATVMSVDAEGCIRASWQTLPGRVDRRSESSTPRVLAQCRTNFCHGRQFHTNSRLWRTYEMRAVVQRVSEASVTVDSETVGDLGGPGLVVLLGVTHDDTPALAETLAARIWRLRILRDERSAADLEAPVLIISQFTLYADTRKGRRPSWSAAAPGPVAEPLYDHFCASLEAAGARVERGRFGASM